MKNAVVSQAHEVVKLNQYVRFLYRVYEAKEQGGKTQPGFERRLAERTYKVSKDQFVQFIRFYNSEKFQISENHATDIFMTLTGRLKAMLQPPKEDEGEYQEANDAL